MANDMLLVRERYLIKQEVAAEPIISRDKLEEISVLSELLQLVPERWRVQFLRHVQEGTMDPEFEEYSNSVNCRNLTQRALDILGDRVCFVEECGLKGYKVWIVTPFGSFCKKHFFQFYKSLSIDQRNAFDTALQEVLKTLTLRERDTIKMRIGFGDTKPLTLRECGEKLGQFGDRDKPICVETVRQIERKASRKLKHIIRVRMLENIYSELMKHPK